MSARKVGTRESRHRLTLLPEQVHAGDEIVVMRRGGEMERLFCPQPTVNPLPDLSELRASVKLRGRALSREVSESRRSNRY